MKRSTRVLLLVAVVLACAVISAVLYGRSLLFLVLAGGALLGAIWLLWDSLQSLTGEAPLSLEEAIGLGAPSAEEERKQAVLRALKDLEYERAVGKISEQDFQDLSRKYRAEAKALLQILDDTLAPARQRAEERLLERLEQEEKLERRDSEQKEAPEREGSEPESSMGTSDDQAEPSEENSTEPSSSEDIDEEAGSDEDRSSSPDREEPLDASKESSPSPARKADIDEPILHEHDNSKKRIEENA